MYILGFNCYVFNSAACLVKDGQLVAAAHEERFNRRKTSGEFPREAISYCLRQAGITLEDVDFVGFHWEPSYRFHRRIGLILRYLPESLRYYGSHAGRFGKMLLAEHELARKLADCAPRYRFQRVRHHVCHAASAYLLSPFEEAATLTVDGSGEMASATFGVAEGNRITLTDEIDYPHSLGYLYVALTHYLGFIPDCDEYKVMALASFGEPEYYEAFKRIVTLHGNGRYRFDLSYFNYHKGKRNPWVSGKFIKTFGPLRRRDEPLTQRHLNIAWALQRRLEDAVFHMIAHLRRTTGKRNLCFAGGSSLNSVLNGRLRREAPFDDIFVQPAGNDAGTCLGAAYYIYNVRLGYPRNYTLEHLYLGPEFTDEECRQALLRHEVAYEELPPEELVRRTAALIADGEVVGWFHGRMEMGSRALGSRSILADPRRPEMKDVLNAKVKHREPFRPFAPSVLEEAAGEYFEDAGASPFMSYVLRIRPSKLSVIPTVAHVDGTARVQTVSRVHAPRYWALIKEFDRLTGVPMVVNTSFNVMGQPIVCTPQEALDCFLSTGIDHLVLNNFLVRKDALVGAAAQASRRAN